MKPLAEMRDAGRLRGLLFDIDDTLTTDGRLGAEAYVAMERLKRAGKLVVPITGRPAGWCDHIARLWPVDAVVGENGAFYFSYADGKLCKQFQDPADVRARNRARLMEIGARILKMVPGSALASDQAYRETDLAIDYCEDVAPLPLEDAEKIAGLMRKEGMTAKISSIHVNGWFGDYDKLAMTRQLFDEVFKLPPETLQREFAFAGDSPNDAPMFAFFEHSVGVANVARFAGKLDAEPKFVTRAFAGAGFAELAAVLLAHFSEHALMEWWWAYLAIGVTAGFLAGLFGIGGGMIMVPMLVFVFTAKGFPAEHMMHLALATSMATIVFTSLSSVRAHHRHDAVDWRIARAMAPGIVAGALAATLATGFIPTRPLAIFFTGFMFYAATQMLIEVKPKPLRQLPGAAGLFGAGAVIGGFSSVLAAGGAFLSIPFLAWCNVPLKRAIGTAAANGFPIALAGSAGYVLNGLRVSGLPDGSLGYVYLPALAIIVAASMPLAPLGARLAHRLPIKRLRFVFALMLFAIALRMLANLW